MIRKAEPVFFWSRMGEPAMNGIHQNAKLVSGFLKALANENRLIILCALAEGEMNVREMEVALEIRQPTLSQQLARLRSDNLVATRRESKQIFYRLASDEAELIIGLVAKLLCNNETAAQEEKPEPATKANAA